MRHCRVIDEVEIWDRNRWQEVTEVGDSLLESPDEFTETSDGDQQ